MARVLLVLPHLPQRMGSPYLGQQYIAASLLAAGHEVRCLDLAAVRWRGSDDVVSEVVDAWQPAVVGMTLFTYNALRGYRLARQLRGRGALLVAGGAHVTACPSEPLRHGFDLAVVGEGEEVVVEIVRRAEAGASFEGMPKVLTRPDADACGFGGEPIEDLDALAFPLTSYPCYETSWYAAEAAVVPGGLMTSRGCPARCTFCANYVTGRAYRWRSAENVVAEMVALREHYGVRHFPFWDDAFTARRPRLEAVCDAIRAEPALQGVTWTCITPGNMVKPADLRRMRAAGCVAVNFGIESGDPEVLRSIQKGQRPHHVRDAVAAARAEGMLTIVNFMFGFPGEGVAALDNTRALMEELSEYTDFFNNRGVLVPFPGTAVYERNHARYGFTEWWLDPARVPDEEDLSALDPLAAQDYLAVDPALDQDFFGYDDDVRERIEACVRFKAEHNRRRVGHPVPLQRNGFDTASPAALQQQAAASVG